MLTNFDDVEKANKNERVIFYFFRIS